MTVPAKAFQQWLHQVAGGASTAAVCRLAGIKKSTLAQQLVRGRVALATVVAVSRALELDVVESIATFEKYRDVVTGMRPPTDAELLSQIADLDLLREILNRSAAAASGVGPARPQLLPVPHRTSVRAWIDAVGPADLRQQLARDSGVAPQNISAQITANRLTPDLAVRAARLAGVGLANGLVVTGLVRPTEAAWPTGSRIKVLQALPNSTLAAVAAERLDAASKTLRRTEQDNTTTQTVWENLA